jgi:hypothetical protein
MIRWICRMVNCDRDAGARIRCRGERNLIE